MNLFHVYIVDKPQYCIYYRSYAVWERASFHGICDQGCFGNFGATSEGDIAPAQLLLNPIEALRKPVFIC